MKKFLAGVFALALVLSLATGALATDVKPYCTDWNNPYPHPCPID